MTYYVGKRTHAKEPFRIVYHEVKTRTSKGYPLTYEWKALPQEYATWEEVLAATEKLNARLSNASRSTGIFPIWP